MAGPTSEVQTLALGIGTLGTALGALAFVAMGSGATGERKRAFFAVTTFVTAAAAVVYFSMFQGFGVVAVTLADGRTLTVYWARYVGWLVAAPLLLLDLALLAGADRTTVATLLGLAAGMVLAGFVGALATGAGSSLGPGATRIAWWGVGCGFFVVLLYYLVSSVSRAAAHQPGDVASLFSTLRNLVVVLWTAYPVVWILGTPGTLGVIGQDAEVVLFLLLDLAATVGFGLVLLRRGDVLEQVASAAGTATAD